MTGSDFFLMTDNDRALMTRWLYFVLAPNLPLPYPPFSQLTGKVKSSDGKTIASSG